MIFWLPSESFLRFAEAKQDIMDRFGVFSIASAVE